MGFLVTLGVFILVVGLIMLVGLRLPKAYHNSGTLLIRQPITAVWDAIQDMDSLPVTGSANHNVTRLPDENDLPVWLIDMGSSQVTIQTIEADPPHQLVRVFADSVAPITARYQYTLSEMGSGTELTVEEEGHIDSGTWHAPIFRIMVRLMPGAGVRTYLHQLADYLGEETAVPIINRK